MSTTIADVKATSFTGEFDSLADGVVSSAIEEVEGQYRTLKKELGILQATVDRLVALHAAHILHVGLAQETSGGEMGVTGPIKSETLNRVGSRSYGSGSKMEGTSSIADWQDSPYGRRHYAIWSKLPPAVCVVQPS